MSRFVLRAAEFPLDFRPGIPEAMCNPRTRPANAPTSAVQQTSGEVPEKHSSPPVRHGSTASPDE